MIAQLSNERNSHKIRLLSNVRQYIDSVLFRFDRLPHLNERISVNIECSSKCFYWSACGAFQIGASYEMKRLNEPLLITRERMCVIFYTSASPVSATDTFSSRFHFPVWFISYGTIHKIKPSENENAPFSPVLLCVGNEVINAALSKTNCMYQSSLCVQISGNNRFLSRLSYGYTWNPFDEYAKVE